MFPLSPSTIANCVTHIALASFYLVLAAVIVSQMMTYENINITNSDPFCISKVCFLVCHTNAGPPSVNSITLDFINGICLSINNKAAFAIHKSSFSFSQMSCLQSPLHKEIMTLSVHAFSSLTLSRSLKSSSFSFSVNLL